MLGADLRVVIRRLVRTPSFSLPTLSILILGFASHIGFAVAIDSLTSARPAGATLEGAFAVSARHRVSQKPIDSSLQSLTDLQASGVLVASLVAHAEAVVTSESRNQRLGLTGIAGDFQDVFGLTVQQGRWRFAEADLEPGTFGIVISDRLWRTWFNADQGIVGRQRLILREGGAIQALVMGVAPPGFRGFSPDRSYTDIWLSFSALRQLDASYDRAMLAGVPLFVRVDEAAVDRTVSLIERQLNLLRSPRDAVSVSLTPATSALATTKMSTTRVALFIASLMVLLSACSSAANLCIARARGHAAEVAVRQALGASWRVATRPVWMEAVVILALAGVIGSAVGVWFLTMLAETLSSARSTTGLQASLNIIITGRLAVYVVCVISACAALTGVAVRSAAWPRTCRALGNTSRITALRVRIRRALTIAQVAVAFSLTMGAGVYLETFVARLVEGGVVGRRENFEASEVVVGPLVAKRAEDVNDISLELAMRLNLIGQPAALADALPGAAGGLRAPTMYLQIPATVGDVDEVRRVAGASVIRITPTYFRVLGLPIITGRDFAGADAADSPGVAILSRSAADKLWPGSRAVGNRLATPVSSARAQNVEWMTVVGVVEDPIVYSFRSETGLPYVFVPLAQHPTPRLNVVLRGRGGAPAARKLVGEIDPNVTIGQFDSAGETALAWISPARSAATLALTISGVALSIALGGVFSVVVFFTSERGREFGIRRALGATERNIVSIVMRDSLRTLLLGLLIGVLMSAVGSRILESAVVKVMPNSIITWMVVPLLTISAGLIAAYVPARIGARRSPIDVLNSQ